MSDLIGTEVCVICLQYNYSVVRENIYILLAVMS